MRKFIKISAYLSGFIVLLIALLLTYVKTMLPAVGEAPNMDIEATPDQLQRGQYLANHVMLCIDCHSTRDWTLFSGPTIAGTDAVSYTHLTLPTSDLV